jgi:hypothetical protein
MFLTSAVYKASFFSFPAFQHLKEEAIIFKHASKWVKPFYFFAIKKKIIFRI